MAYKNKMNKSMQQKQEVFQHMKKKEASSVEVVEHTTKIFTPMCLVDFCYANFCAEQDTKESEYEFDWEDFLEDDVVDLYDELTSDEQKAFDQKIVQVLTTLRAKFTALPRNIESKEEYELFQRQKKELSVDVVKLMNEYVK